MPFLSKFASEMIGRLQKKGFDFRGDGMKPFEELAEMYPGCLSALRWWCDENGKGSRFGISRFKWLKEFMVTNPPAFRISQECCKGAKKDTASSYVKGQGFDLVLVGLRRSENGIRSQRIAGCLTKGETSQFRPLWWLSDDDRKRYEEAFGVFHSACYSEYGLKRTGCAGCPFGSRFENELEAIAENEPKLFKAVCSIFGDSYEYTRKYREFKKGKD